MWFLLSLCGIRFWSVVKLIHTRYHMVRESWAIFINSKNLRLFFIYCNKLGFKTSGFFYYPFSYLFHYCWLAFKHSMNTKAKQFLANQKHRLHHQRSHTITYLQLLNIDSAFALHCNRWLEFLRFTKVWAFIWLRGIFDGQIKCVSTAAVISQSNYCWWILIIEIFKINNNKTIAIWSRDIFARIKIIGFVKFEVKNESKTC